MWPFKKKDPIPAFWSWFLKNEQTLITADAHAIVARGGLSDRLKKIHPSLVWELSAADHPPPREFILSADGDKSAFGAVEAIADAAPPLPRWKIIRFRPRMPNYAGLGLEIGPVSLRADDVEAVLSRSSTLMGVDLYMRGCPAPDDPEFVRAGFIMLDICLGEYDVECKLGRFRVFPFETQAKVERIPWRELRDSFDREFDRLHPPV